MYHYIWGKFKRMHRPTYDFDDFIMVCANDEKMVYIGREAIKTARQFLNLKTSHEICSFIGSGGLEKPSFINTTPWDNNPNPSCLIMVDAYSFYSYRSHGYLAFLYQPITQKWIIKSFKEFDDPAKYVPFKGLLLNAGGESE